MDAALRLSGISKTFGQTIAVQDMDLVVPRGALYGVIGPNGAGKTTCIRMIMSILFPDAGELSVLGPRVGARGEGPHRVSAGGAWRLPQDARGCVPHLHGAAERADERRCASPRGRRLLERVGLAETERKRCEDLSKGMLQRVQIAAAIIHEPDLLILDEPFSGLDPVSVRLLRELIVDEHRRGRDHSVLDACHGARGGDLPARGDDPSGTESAGRADGWRCRRRFDPRALRFEPLDPDADLSPITRACRKSSASSARTTGYTLRLVEGTDATAAIHRIAGVDRRSRASSCRVLHSRTCSSAWWPTEAVRRLATRCAPVCRGSMLPERPYEEGRPDCAA